MTDNAARSEAWQWLGWAESILSYEDVQMRYEGYPDLDDTPFGRGLAGERPDAQALAAARAEGRDDVLSVVQRLHDGECPLIRKGDHFAWYSTLAYVLRACNAATPETTEG